MRLGFIGYGEAAFCISGGLGENGVTGIVAFDKMQDTSGFCEKIRSRAAEAKVELMASPKEVVDTCDVVIVAVPSHFAVEACEMVREYLRPGQIYADVSASSPTIKETIWAMVQDTGVLFADAAMMGLLPIRRHKVPITASGNGAAAFAEAVTPIGMNVKVIGERPGMASAIKLIRSIYMKGYDALLFEMLRAAEAFDVFDEIIDNVGESMDNVPFRTLIEWMFPGLGVHSVRRAAEMRWTEDMLAEKNIESGMTCAIRDQLDLISEIDLNGLYREGWPDSKDWKEVFHYVNNYKGENK